jgi:hypothetical protein
MCNIAGPAPFLTGAIKRPSHNEIIRKISFTLSNRASKWLLEVKRFTTEEVLTLFTEDDPLNDDARDPEMTFSEYQGVDMEDSEYERLDTTIERKPAAR